MISSFNDSCKTISTHLLWSSGNGLSFLLKKNETMSASGTSTLGNFDFIGIAVVVAIVALSKAVQVKEKNAQPVGIVVGLLLIRKVRENPAA